MFYLETLLTSKDLPFPYFSVFLTFKIRNIGNQLKLMTFWFVENFVSLVENNL